MKKKRSEFQKAEIALEHFMLGIINALFSNQGIDRDRAIIRFNDLLMKVLKVRKKDHPTRKNKKDEFSFIKNPLKLYIHNN